MNIYYVLWFEYYKYGLHLPITYFETVNIIMLSEVY